MNKNLFILAFALIFGISSNGYAADNYQSYCPQSPYPVAGSFSRGVQTITGMNFLTTQVAQMAISNELKKEMQGNFNVKIKSFSATDLAKGKFKSVRVSGKNVVADGNYISSFDTKSLCGYTYYDYKSKPAALKTPVAMKFSSVIDEKDLQNTLKSTQYQKEFAKMKIGTNKFSLFAIQNPDISIENNHLFFAFETNTNMLLFKQILKYKVGFNIKVADKKINFSDVTLSTPLAMLDVSDIASIFNRISPMISDPKIMPGYNTKIELNNVEIKDNKINLDGAIVLQK